MTDEHLITRRHALQAVVATTISVTGRAWAQSRTTATPVTPSQTAGPFYPDTKPVDGDFDLTQVAGYAGKAWGDIVQVSGQVLDTNRQPLSGAIVEIWQANTYGRYDHEADASQEPLDQNFQGWGRVKTDATGFYRFKTVIPGSYAVTRQWTRPPHIHFRVSRQGHRELVTQMYFAGHSLNDADRLLLALPPAEREKLIVRFRQPRFSDESLTGAGVFNIILERA